MRYCVLRHGDGPHDFSVIDGFGNVIEPRMTEARALEFSTAHNELDLKRKNEIRLRLEEADLARRNALSAQILTPATASKTDDANHSKVPLNETDNLNQGMMVFITQAKAKGVGPCILAGCSLASGEPSRGEICPKLEQGSFGLLLTVPGWVALLAAAGLPRRSALTKPGMPPLPASRI